MPDLVPVTSAYERLNKKIDQFAEACEKGKRRSWRWGFFWGWVTAAIGAAIAQFT